MGASRLGARDGREQLRARDGREQPHRGASSVLCKRPFCFLAPQGIGAVGKWESWVWISSFPLPALDSSFWCLALTINEFFGYAAATPAARAFALEAGRQPP